MILTRADFIMKLVAAGIPAARFALTAPDEIAANLFGTVPADFIQASWDAWVKMFADNAPALVQQRDIGGGKTRMVPNYIAPGFVCRHAAFSFYAHLLDGLAIRAATTPQANDGYAIAVVYYTATPRAEDGNRDGRHARILFVDDTGAVCEFEEGDGDPEPMTPAELGSISFILAT